jgi:hypothetical protein
MHMDPKTETELERNNKKRKEKKNRGILRIGTQSLKKTRPTMLASLNSQKIGQHCP